MWKLAPALAAGNSCILKPAPQTPFSTLLISKLAQISLPPHTVDVVLGGADVGSALAAHPDVNMISFTGSTSAGRHVAKTVSYMGPKRVSMELGGKNAIIVCGDANLEEASNFVVEAAFCMLNNNV